MSQATAPVRARMPVGRPSPDPRTRHRRGLRVVPAAIESSRNGTFALLCITLLVGGLLVLLLLNTQLAQGSFALHELADRSGTLTDEEHELTRALDAERNPAALADKAIQLGMVPASSMAFIRLSDGAIIGVAEPATAERAITVVTGPRGHQPSPPAPVATPTPGQPAAPAAPVDPAAANDPELPDPATGLTTTEQPPSTPTVTQP